ncbi:MAG: DUF481 domain-containing protein [Bernardetiaceae bacterium]|nr:DUF481 domain-containing protein [Bernardetiaceae bacterium]
MFRSLFLFVVLFFCIHYVAESQILNIERARIKEDSTHYFFANGSFNIRTFNRTADEDTPVQLLSMGSNLGLSYFSPLHSYMLLGHFDFFSINQNTFSSTGYLHPRVKILRSRTLSYELFGQVQFDYIRGLDLRYLGGGGLRLRIINSKSARLRIGMGIMYEHEEWQNPKVEGEVRTTQFLKSTNYVSTHIDLSDAVSLNAIAYYQVGRDNLFQAFRHRVNIDTNLNISIAKRFAFKFSVMAAYDTAPIVPITKLVYSLENGITFNLQK